ncbi:MAG: hypothetical protein ACFFB5_07350 [Promethearchaeota archaeon]
MRSLFFFKESIFLSGAATITQVFWFIFKIITMRQVTNYDYSIFIFGVSSVLAFQLFGHFHLFKSMSILISKYPTESSEGRQNALESKEYREIIKSHLTLGLILTFVSGITLSVFLYLDTQNSFISLVYAADLLLQNLILYFYFLFLGLKKTVIGGLTLLATNLFRLILLIGFSLHRTISLEGVILFYTMGSFFAFLMSFILAKLIFNSKFFPIGRDLKEILENFSIIKNGIFLALISIIVQIFSTIMYFFIKLFDYASSKEADISLMFCSAFLIFFISSGVLISVKPHLLVEKRKFTKEILFPLALLSSVFTILVGILLFLNLQIYEDISGIIFNIHYKSLQPYLLISLISIPFHSIYVVCLGFSTGNGLLKRQFSCNLSSFIIVLPFLILLSFSYGAKGVILSYSLFSLFLAFFSIIIIFTFEAEKSDSILFWS